MDKRLIFPGNTERRDLFFVREDRNYLRKHGSSYHPKIAKYIEDAKPMKDLVQILLTALGAHEFWGQNVNGDRFREKALEHKGNDYGYETFKTNANYFVHHVNKDPALAKGKVLHSVWNEKTKRVELIVGIDINLDPDAIKAVDAGENLAFSMGARVPFDVCSECGNRAKTRAEYCDHLRYMMNQINPLSGNLVGADNLFPKFFDISRVLIPADKTAYMWTKVASAAGENPYTKLSSAFLAELPPGKLNDLPYLEEKVAEQREQAGSKPGTKKDVTKTSSVIKKSDITKRIPTQMKPEAILHLEKVIPPTKALLQADSPNLPPEVIARLRALAPSLGHLLSTIIAVGIEPKAEEVSMLVGPETTPESLNSLKLAADLFTPAVAEALVPYLSERSYARPHLASRVLSLAQRLEDGDQELTKKAQTIRELMADGPAPRPLGVDHPTHPGLSPGVLAGMAAALYALFGPHAGPIASRVGRHLADNPLIYMALAATAVSAMNRTGGTQKNGLYDVDDPNRSLYNNNWQSHFARMQARPVTVIKTGAVDTEVAKKVYYGLPLIFGASHIARFKRDANAAQGQRSGKITHFIADHPEVVAGGMFAEHLVGRPISKHVSKALESGKRIFKHASIRDLDFLNSVPDEEKPLFWDLAILDASARIAEKIGG